jgi:SAM-dependent methyltransferase
VAGDGPRHTTDGLARRLDGRLASPSAERNRRPILEALGQLLAGASGTVLEVGSGTGQHAVAFAAALPGLDWQPSDPADAHLVSIRAWAAGACLPNLRAPIRLDAAGPWPDLGPLAAVLAINVIHIAPWAVAAGIVRGSAGALAAGAPLIFYGPFKEGGQHTGGGNARFDAALRAEDPAWGVRDLGDLTAAAARAGFAGPQVTPMPANNRLVGYRRR